MRHPWTLRTWTVLAALLVFVGGPPIHPAEVKTALQELFPVPSTTGNEGALAGRVRALLPAGLAAEEDGLGGFAVRTGPGRTGLLVFAALDGYGHFVSGITAEGYLTLDRAVPPPHAQFDAYLLGQPVIISTRKGLIQGVVAQPAMHLLTPDRRRALVENFSLENAFVDIAVRSVGEARAKGVEILDAVTFWPALTELAGEKWSGPALGLKAACAALAAAAAEPGKDGAADAAVLVWAAQTKFAARGRNPRTSLGALRARNRWQSPRTVILDLVAAEKGPGTPALGKGPVLVVTKDAPSPLREGLERAAGAGGIPLQHLAGSETPLAAAFADGAADVVTLALPVQFLHTPSEVVDLRDVQTLRDLLAALLRTGGER
jgi:putative aminopeptidase FrvX